MADIHPFALCALQQGRIVIGRCLRTAADSRRILPGRWHSTAACSPLEVLPAFPRRQIHSPGPRGPGIFFARSVETHAKFLTECAFAFRRDRKRARAAHTANPPFAETVRA